MKPHPALRRLPALLLLLGVLPAVARPAAEPAIGQLQGDGPRSPLVGEQVTVTATVSADFREGLGGIFVQDAGDGDPRTSDGLFVQPVEGFAFPDNLGVGTQCRFHGRVVELDGRGGDSLTTLQVDRVDRCRAGTPVRAQAVQALPGDWEALEGMTVRIEAPLTVTGTDALQRFGELAVSFDGRQWQPSERARAGSAEHAALAAANARTRLLLDDASRQRDPEQVAYLGGGDVPRTGSVVRGAEGIVDPRHGWRLQLTGTPSIEVAARPAPPQVPGNVRVAAFNLENLFNGDGQGGGFPTPRGAKTPQALDAQLAKLVATIQGLDPDVAALMELENDGYGPDSGLARLVQVLNADGAQWRFVDAGRGPGTDTIRVGLIYRGDRLVARGKPAVLEGGPFGERSRVPLAQAFRRKDGGKDDFVVVANHLKSKGCSEAEGADADRKDGQGCWNALRLDSAQRLHAWLQSAPLGKGRERVAILGDFNAYAMEDPVRWLREEGGWTDALKAAAVAAPGSEPPYSYVYQGLSGRLDHALLSPALVPHLRGATEWHVNADEPDDAGYAGRNVPGPWRSSDHDPLLLGFDL
ncbi:ExeM/NucH family extracellular endonuclease [Pseudoxanthomonas daejeonensis]|uniref:Endonuclease n=1 Tax=Pseudoxanthomonas daejeonensis TaxID=266062 RepID=A0ABQ6ZBT6_9GAMM|nr:ExeM/NucH family extracellular endonuclease [Pseudoxanthomonas daejeonensis]KAF1697502.1 endonuclease [Pseudoxanthomonas daejeonensis]